jgi:hypothetical protein
MKSSKSILSLNHLKMRTLAWAAVSELAQSPLLARRFLSNDFETHSDGHGSVGPAPLSMTSFRTIFFSFVVLQAASYFVRWP